MMPFTHPHSPARSTASQPGAALGLACLLSLALLQPGRAAEPNGAVPGDQGAATKTASARTLPVEVKSRDLASHVREAVGSGDLAKKRLTLIINGKEQILYAQASKAGEAAKNEPAAVVAPAVARKPAPVTYVRGRPVTASRPAAPAVRAHEIHWSYEGEGGPPAWGNLKPEFKTCATGKRQSPIHIEDSVTLQGPAEAIQFSYQPSSATVINNGHTIQVDVYGDNAITVRGSTYKLIQFHFHHPSEERINYKSYAMVAHLVHRNADGQLAVVAVLLDPGEANALIDKVWTYMPLDANDKVRTPDAVVDLNQLLPQDQRYYQFLGSLTTPPCSEGVLWMVLKRPVTLSREQIKLFGQLFPNNARPVQAVNGRPIRDAQ
jgi:carbonic anhydrase